MSGDEPVTVLAGVEQDLAALDDDDLARSALAATALSLARQIDSGRHSLTAEAAASGRLQEIMRELRELAPPRVEGDGIDQLADRRAARRLSA